MIYALVSAPSKEEICSAFVVRGKIRFTSDAGSMVEFAVTELMHSGPNVCQLAGWESGSALTRWRVEYDFDANLGSAVAQTFPDRRVH